MKLEKLKKLDYIFNELGYYIKDNVMYNKKGRKIGYKTKEVKEGKTYYRKMVSFGSRNEKCLYTYNEVLAWNNGVFKNVKNPENIFINDKLIPLNQDSKDRILKGVKEYFKTDKNREQIANKLKVCPAILGKEIINFCNKNDLTIPIKKINGKIYYKESV